MFIKIYIGISVLCFWLLCLFGASLTHQTKIKYSDKFKRTEKRIIKRDIAGSILSWLKMLIMCFIPGYNVLLLFAIIFMGDKMKSETDKKIKEIIEKDK